jgi:Fe-S-cluster formation regulator IscX/YfhJ
MLPLLLLSCVGCPAGLCAQEGPFTVREEDDQIVITSSTIEAAIRKKGYVSGVAGGSFLDKQTGFRDVGFGLDIVDWIMEPGSDEAYRDQLPGDLAYTFNNLVHGSRPKRSIEGPQICTKARELSPTVIRGKDFVAVRMSWQYRIAAPGKKTGSTWDQTLVFPAGKRWFLSSDRITSVNDSDALFLRIDMPGHVKHKQGDTFSEIYLSYHGRIPAAEFLENFPPDAKFNYRRDAHTVPDRFIRAYRVRDPATGKQGPWLAGMTLDPSIVYEAWCHQRNYVCMIEEFGGRPVRAGESFSAAFIVGWFDSLEEMEAVYDGHKGATGLEVTESGWRWTK